MPKTKVKQYLKRTKRGGIEQVREHLRYVKGKLLKEEEVNDIKKQPNSTHVDIDGKKLKVAVGTRSRFSDKESRVVTNKGKIIVQPLSPEFIKDRYEKKFPMTWKIMTSGKFDLKKLKNGKTESRIKLNEQNWKDLLKEHEPLINTLAKRYSYNQNYGDRYEENKAIANSGFVEGVNAYGKFFNPKNPPDFSRVVFAYVQGRLKESTANRLDAGLRIPNGLQKPYQQFLKVKQKFSERGINNPTDEQIADVLDKVWNKNTFYPQYKLAEEKSYKIKQEKKIKILKGKNKGKYKKVYETKYLSFNELPKDQQNALKKLDRLPMNGFVTLKKEGTLKGKEEKHDEKLKDIDKKYEEEFNRLEEDYLLNKTMSPKDRKIGENIIEDKKKAFDDLDKQHKQLLSSKMAERIKIEAQTKFLKDQADKLETEIKGKESTKLSPSEKGNLTKTKNKVSKLLDEVKKINSNEYIDSQMRTINKDIRDVQIKMEQAAKDYRTAEQFYKPIDEKEYESRKENIERRKQADIANETSRYNKDQSSTFLPGIIQRIREFSQIQSIKDVPLNLTIEGDEGASGDQMHDLIIRPDELRQDELVDLLDTHRMAKNYLRSNINTLMPVYRDAFGLYTGLHDKSPLTTDKLWGQLSTYDDIEKFLDKKHKVILENPDKFSEVMKRATPENRKLLIGVVPYIASRYRNDPDLIVKDYKTWEDNKPKVGNVKEKLDKKKFTKLLNDWKKNKIKAKKEWTIWRKKNPNAKQEASTKKYNQIKSGLKANETNRPKNFVLVKQVPKEKIENWKTKKPQIFNLSKPEKDRYLKNIIEDSIDIMRRITPIRKVKDLLSAHRKLVENGIELEKANTTINEVSNYMHSYWLAVRMAQLFGLNEAALPVNVTFNQIIDGHSFEKANGDDNLMAFIKIKNNNSLVKTNKNEKTFSIVWSQKPEFENHKLVPQQ